MPSTAIEKKQCEAHPYLGVECSGDAEFVLRRHDKTHLICRAAAHHIWAIGRTRCYACKQPIWKHWDTEPI